MEVSSLRKLVLVGYAFDAPTGAPLLNSDGMPHAPLDCPVRMRIAFWIPQKEPFRARPVASYDSFLRRLVKEHMEMTPAALSETYATLTEYAHRFKLDERVMTDATPPLGYTMVADANDRELQALRDGAIEEQLQDFTFTRQPTMNELRDATRPHWELRTLRATGAVPNLNRHDLSPAKFHISFGAP